MVRVIEVRVPSDSVKNVRKVLDQYAVGEIKMRRNHLSLEVTITYDGITIGDAAFAALAGSYRGAAVNVIERAPACGVS